MSAKAWGFVHLALVVVSFAVVRDARANDGPMWVIWAHGALAGANLGMALRWWTRG